MGRHRLSIHVKNEDLLNVKKVVCLPKGFALIKFDDTVTIVGTATAASSDLTNISDVVSWSNGFVFLHHNGKIDITYSIDRISKSIFDALQPKDIILSSSLIN